MVTATHLGGLSLEAQAAALCLCLADHAYCQMAVNGSDVVGVDARGGGAGGDACAVWHVGAPVLYTTRAVLMQAVAHLHAELDRPV